MVYECFRRERRLRLTEQFEGFVTRAFEHRVLTSDEAAARTYGDVMAFRQKLGRPMSVPDGQLAAIARVHGFTVATRNV